VTDCPVLPATGSSLMSILVVAAIVAALGVVLVVAGRRWAVPVMVVVHAAGVVAVVAASGVTAYAATTCPPPSTAPSVAPTSTPGSPTSTTSTTSTSSSTTTTVAGTAPTANGDDEIFTVGVPFTLNVLTNDVLGDPPATISTFSLGSGPVCAGVSFDQGTGVLSGTLTVPLLPCLLSYTLQNSAGTSTAVASLTGGPA
jgi:LPXTG-motif cell wall-anchored protein